MKREQIVSYDTYLNLSIRADLWKWKSEQIQQQQIKKCCENLSNNIKEWTTMILIANEQQ